MFRARLKKALCVLLVFMLVGCRSEYHLKLHSDPPGAAVIIESNRYGTTPCELEIPIDNELVRDGSLTVRYILPEGREVTQTYDLEQYKPPNTLAAVLVGVLAVPGVILIAIGAKDNDDDDDWPDDDDDENDYGLIASGAGLLVAAGLIMHIFDVKLEGLGGYDIHVTIPEAYAPTEPNEPFEAPSY